MKSFKEFFDEAYKDLGKLSPEQLRKGFRLIPDEKDNFQQVDGRVFYNALVNFMHNDAVRENSDPIFFKNIRNNLTIYSVSDYKKMKCFLGKNNSSGFAIKDGNELVSVVSTLEASGNAVVQEAIKQGATRLDCFAKQDSKGNVVDDGLYKLYKRSGFIIDKSKNDGILGSPYSVQAGISYYVYDSGKVDPTNSTIVIFMV